MLIILLCTSIKFTPKTINYLNYAKLLCCTARFKSIYLLSTAYLSKRFSSEWGITTDTFIEGLTYDSEKQSYETTILGLIVTNTFTYFGWQPIHEKFRWLFIRKMKECFICHCQYKWIRTTSIICFALVFLFPFKMLFTTATRNYRVYWILPNWARV